ncbi:MAG: hypothetical protein C6W57_13930 [Caldibacillus debilis]|nr:MAG: hypothetical protein BAA03_15885 [Caldibacillus debilis]REJ14530.1 MAG: hypothetical protein C6W57_13930 [Caldibacillus debilis]
MVRLKPLQILRKPRPSKRSKDPPLAVFTASLPVVPRVQRGVSPVRDRQSKKIRPDWPENAPEMRIRKGSHPKGAAFFGVSAN